MTDEHDKHSIYNMKITIKVGYRLFKIKCNDIQLKR